MASGLSAYYINKIQNHMLQAAASTAPASVNAQLHTGEPGAAGTTAVSTDTRRQAATFGANNASGVSAMSNTPSWSAFTGGSVSITNISTWDSVTAGAGNFLFSALLTTAKAIATGDTFTLSSLTNGIGPVAS